MGNNRIQVFTPGLLSRVNNPVWSEARVDCPGSGTGFGECGDMTDTATVSATSIDFRATAISETVAILAVVAHVDNSCCCREYQVSLT